MRLLLNILWFIFGGWISMLAWVIAAILLAITVVGLPWSLAACRMAGFSAAPFGREVVAQQTGAGAGVLTTILNVVWLVFAGWWLALHHLVLALALFCSLIGIPFGLQHLKLALVSLAPVGTSIVER